MRSTQHYIQPALPGLESHVSRVKPAQLHHFATNKSQQWTHRFESIVTRYGLELDGAWNKERLPHLGSHPEKYRQWVLREMQRIDERAAGDTDRFLQLFEEFVKEPVRKMPDMLDAEYWSGSR